jgi:hypothetical protein
MSRTDDETRGRGHPARHGERNRHPRARGHGNPVRHRRTRDVCPLLPDRHRLRGELPCRARCRPVLRPEHVGVLRIGEHDLSRRNPTQRLQRPVHDGQSVPDAMHTAHGPGHVLRHRIVGVYPVHRLPRAASGFLRRRRVRGWLPVQLGSDAGHRLRNGVRRCFRRVELLLLRRLRRLLPLAHRGLPLSKVCSDARGDATCPRGGSHGRSLDDFPSGSGWGSRHAPPVVH